MSDYQMIATGTLLIINSYNVGFFGGNFLLFDSCSKDEIGRMSATGTAVLLKSDSLQSLENYIKSTYYSDFPLTLYFQIQFSKLKCTESTKSTIKRERKREKKEKSERKKKVSSLKKNIKDQ